MKNDRPHHRHPARRPPTHRGSRPGRTVGAVARSWGGGGVVIPKGLCQCGCGQPAPIATMTSRKSGAVKGQPQRFVAGHQNLWAAKQDRAPRFWAKVEKTADCWIWNGSRHPKGDYGDFKRNEFGRTVHTLAHRYAYELMVGPIPGGLVLDHQENRLRGSRPPGGSHCIHGHEKTPENTYVYKGKRGCRTCRSAASKRGAA